MRVIVRRLIKRPDDIRGSVYHVRYAMGRGKRPFLKWGEIRLGVPVELPEELVRELREAQCTKYRRTKTKFVATNHRLYSVRRVAA